MVCLYRYNGPGKYSKVTDHVVLEGFDVPDVRDVELGGFRFFIKYIQKAMREYDELVKTKSGKTYYSQADFDLVDLQLRQYYSTHLKEVRVAWGVDQAFKAAMAGLKRGLSKEGEESYAAKYFENRAMDVAGIGWNEHALAINFQGFVRIINSDDAHLKDGAFDSTTCAITVYDSPPNNTSLRYENAARLRAMEPSIRLETLFFAFFCWEEALAELTCKTHPDLNRWYRETNVPEQFVAFRHRYGNLLWVAHDYFKSYNFILGRKTYLRIHERALILKFLINYLGTLPTNKLSQDDYPDFASALESVIQALNQQRTEHPLPIANVELITARKW